MKRILLSLLMIISLREAALAQTSSTSPDAQPTGLLILSKQGSGPILRDSLSLTLASGPGCDQTQSRIPDGSRMISDSFALNVNDSGLGTFYGSVRIVTAKDEILHVGIIRGTVGINDCDPTSTICAAVCNRPWHLEGIYEPAPTFARNPNGEVAIANFKADLDPRVAGPLPIYRARLDGWFAPPPTFAQRIRITPEKSTYLANETIQVSVTNSSESTIQGYDLKSRCSILELQRQEGDRWMTAGQCFLRRAPLPVNIKPGETVQVDLQPTGNSAPIRPGVYRIALTFRVLDDDKMLSDYFVAFSPLLRVNGMPQREAVSVSLDSDRYFKGQAINVTIDNNTARAIRTFDHQTNCSIVTVQRLQDGNWVNVGECPLASPTRPVKIASRESVAVKLPAAPFTGDFEPGVYRVEFSYEELDASEQNVVRRVKLHSAQFRIVPSE